MKRYVLFKYKDIPVRVHPTFFLLFIGLLIPSIINLNLAGVFLTALLLVGLFTSVILHEFGHALMAKKFGIKTQSITLYPFGGIAAIENMEAGGKQEVYIALAGPAVNLILCIFLLPLMLMGVPLSFELLFINLVMAVFNLVPAFPMDGGRVLRAILSRWMHVEDATDWSLRISAIFVVLFSIAGIYFRNVGLFLVAIAVGFFIRSERKRQLENKRRELKWEMFREK